MIQSVNSKRLNFNRTAMKFNYRISFIIKFRRIAFFFLLDLYTCEVYKTDIDYDFLKI